MHGKMFENNIREDLVNKKWGVPVHHWLKQLGDLSLQYMQITQIISTNYKYIFSKLP